MNTKETSETMSRLQRFLYTENSTKFIQKLVEIYNGIMTQALLIAQQMNGVAGESRLHSERRNRHRTSAKRTTRRMVALCDGMLLILSQRA